MSRKKKLATLMAISLSLAQATPALASSRPPANHFGGGVSDIHFAEPATASHLASDFHMAGWSYPMGTARPSIQGHHGHPGSMLGLEIHTHNAPNGYAYGEFLGVLEVQRLNRRVNVYGGATMSAMDKGAGHFSFTGLDGGNTGLIGHNRGRTNGFFGFVRLLQEGDIITLTRGDTVRTFVVSHSFIVDETDFSPLQQFGDNRLTLVTCVEYQRSQRRIAVALEI